MNFSSPLFSPCDYAGNDSDFSSVLKNVKIVIANRFGVDCSKMAKTDFDRQNAQDKTKGEFRVITISIIYYYIQYHF